MRLMLLYLFACLFISACASNNKIIINDKPEAIKTVTTSKKDSVKLYDKNLFKNDNKNIFTIIDPKDPTIPPAPSSRGSNSKLIVSPDYRSMKNYSDKNNQ